MAIFLHQGFIFRQQASEKNHKQQETSVSNRIHFSYFASMFSTSVSDVSLQEEHWEREAAAPLEKSVNDIGSFFCFFALFSAQFGKL